MAACVHAIVPAVSMQVTANVILALGGDVTMTQDARQQQGFVRRSQAVLFNFGMMGEDLLGTLGAIEAAASARRLPFVIDPAHVCASHQRKGEVLSLLARADYVLKCNRYEFECLFDRSADLENVIDIAKAYEAVVIVTGEVDLLTDGYRVARFMNGSAYMDCVVGVGCALGGALALALAQLYQEQGVAGSDCSNMPLRDRCFDVLRDMMLCYTVSGEVAAQHAAGPGTFLPHFLDVLSTYDVCDYQDIVRYECADA